MPDLSGKHFLVLRPKATSEKLLRCLSESKAKVSHFPMFEPEPRNSKELQSMLDTLDAAEKVIFVSPSAVEFFLARLGELGLELPEKARCFAPGFSTASTLASKSKAEARYPKDVGDATSLLSMPEFEGVEGQRIDITGVDPHRSIVDPHPERCSRLDQCCTATARFIDTDLHTCGRSSIKSRNSR